MNKSVSPSRRYVAMCSRVNFNGYRFKAFELPERDPWAAPGEAERLLENTSTMASWYFLNRLDGVACIDGCIAEEDFKSVEEVESLANGGS